MKNEWILDVLVDLRDFAMSNELPELATQLERTTLVARFELAQGEGIGLDVGRFERALRAAQQGNNA